MLSQSYQEHALFGFYLNTRLLLLNITRDHDFQKYSFLIVSDYFDKTRMTDRRIRLCIIWSNVREKLFYRNETLYSKTSL